MRIARRLATTSLLDPASAWAAIDAILSDSGVVAAPRPIESALAEKSGRGGKEGCAGTVGPDVSPRAAEGVTDPFLI